MIVKEVNKFMALMPLMLPKLIDSKQCVEPASLRTQRYCISTLKSVSPSER